jgi:acetolactate synthase regulatory subunit
MIWRFEVIATAEQRLLSRILQVFEVQQVSIRTFAGEIDGTAARVTFVVSSQQDRANRIEALLYRLEGVDQISVTTGFDGEKVSEQV